MRIPAMVSSFYFLLIYYKLNKKGGKHMKFEFGETKEPREVYDEWRKIPGFSSYDIGRNTKYVRSHKHYKSDSHHIMKQSIASLEKNPSIQLTDDAGMSRLVSRDELYDLAFNSEEYEERGQYEVYFGGMMKPNRYMKAAVQPVGTGHYDRENIKYGPDDQIIRYPVSYNPEDKFFTLNFSNSRDPIMVKPFTYDYSLNK